jgi:ABC-2 type transport system permease protein
MMVMTAILTSLTIVKEREVGTLEQLISTPVRTYEIMIGKIIPYFIIGMIDSIMVALIGVLVMGVPFRGSVWLFLSGTALFAMAGLGIGLRISTAAQNQVVAMQMALLSSMLPSFLLSGFVFAIKNMPAWVQAITYIVPARYFLVVLRGIFLKDAVFSMLWPEFLFLGLLCAVMLITCIKSFKKKVG